MKTTRAATVALAAALLLTTGCPQVDAGDSGASSSTGATFGGTIRGTTGGDGSTQSTGTDGSTTNGSTASGSTGGPTTGGSTTTGSGTGTTGSTASSTTGSTTGGRVCDGSAAAPSLSCEAWIDGVLLPAGRFVKAGQAVELRCTTDANDPGFTHRESLGGAVVTDRLGGVGSSSRRLILTWTSASLPLAFKDTRVDVDLDVANCAQPSQRRSVRVSFTLLGNLLAARFDTSTVEVFTSDGKSRGTLIGSLALNKPVLLRRLPNGNLLVGSTPTGTVKALQEFDLTGRLVRAWDDTDTSAQPLFAGDLFPYDAAFDSAGHAWVSAFDDEFAPGKLYRFDQQGLWEANVTPPADVASQQHRWGPNALTVMSDGTLLAGNGASGSTYAWLAVFPPNGAASRYLKLPLQVCTDPGNGGTPTCVTDAFHSFGPIQGMEASNGRVSVVSSYNRGVETYLSLVSESLSFELSTARVYDRSDTTKGMYSVWGHSAVKMGDQWVMSQKYQGCLLALAPRTLFIDPDPLLTNGCWNGFTSSPAFRGLVHLDR